MHLSINSQLLLAFCSAMAKTRVAVILVCCKNAKTAVIYLAAMSACRWFLRFKSAKTFLASSTALLCQCWSLFLGRNKLECFSIYHCWENTRSLLMWSTLQYYVFRVPTHNRRLKILFGDKHSSLYCQSIYHIMIFIGYWYALLWNILH